MIMLIISLVAGVYVVRGLTTTSSTNHVKNLIKKWIENTDFEQKTKMCLLAMNDPAMASALTSKLYRASMVGTLEELYFLSRSEMECPCGAVAGFIAQIATIIISIPVIVISKKATCMNSVLEIDWLHFIETIMMWASIHVQCMSFRQAVLSVENKKSLPEGTLHYKPMLKALFLIYGSIFAIAMCHYSVNTDSWQHTELFGGLLNPPTPGITRDRLTGELSFLTWAFHWSMVLDYCLTLPRYMWRWGDSDCTGNKKWKLYTILHLPAFMVNWAVMANHLHRDQILALQLLHPLLVFIGSIATLYGSFAVSRANGWNHYSDFKDTTPTILKTQRKGDDPGQDWDLLYSLASVTASILAYGSLYLTV